MLEADATTITEVSKDSPVARTPLAACLVAGRDESVEICLITTLSGTVARFHRISRFCWRIHREALAPPASGRT